MFNETTGTVGGRGRWNTNHMCSSFQLNVISSFDTQYIYFLLSSFKQMYTLVSLYWNACVVIISLNVLKNYLNYERAYQYSNQNMFHHPCCIRFTFKCMFKWPHSLVKTEAWFKYVWKVERNLLFRYALFEAPRTV